MARSSTLIKSSDSESLRSSLLDDILVTGPTLCISRRLASKFFSFMSLFVVLLIVLAVELEEISRMEDEEWRLKNNDGADVDLVIFDVLLRRPNVDGEGAKRPEEPSVSATLVALETTFSLSSSLAHNSSFSPMDVSDRFDDRLLRRRWSVGRPVFLVLSSMSSVVPMERKGDVFAGGRFGSDDPFFATILFDTDCAIVDVRLLSTLPPLASPSVEIAGLCLRCDEERASSGNLEDRETDITDYVQFWGEAPPCKMSSTAAFAWTMFLSRPMRR